MRLFNLFRRPKNSEIHIFPEIEEVFETDLDKCREFFFPVCSIALSDINEAWGDDKIHLIQFNEDPYNQDTAKYFTDYCKDCMISFELRNGKYKFQTDFGFFTPTEDWKEWQEKTKETYFESKSRFREMGSTFGIANVPIGGEPDWWQADETPLDPDGKPMTFITEFETDSICDDSCDKKIFLFYSHQHRLAVQLYQIT